MMRRPAWPFAALLVACTGGDGDVPEVNGCDDGVRLAASSGAPASRIAVEGWPGNDATIAIVSVDGTPVTVTGFDGQHLVVPVHEAGIGGGDVTFQLTDGDTTCAPVAFTIEAIPPAPGSFAALRDHLAAIVAKVGRTEGLDVPTLQTETDLPPTMLPVAAASALLDDSFEYSGAQLDAVALEALDAVVAHSGLVDAARALDEAVVDPGGRSLRSVGTTRRALSACIDIDDAEDLADKLSRHEANDAVNTVLRPTIDLSADASMAIGVKHPLAGAIIGAVAWGMQTTLDGTKSRLPSKLANLRYEAMPLEFDEDSTVTGRYMDVKVDAGSEGWDLTKTAIDLFLMKKAAKAAELGQVGEKVVQQVGKGADWAQRADKLVDKSLDVGSAACGRVSACSNPGLVTLEPCVWAGIDISEFRYHQVDVRAAPEIAIDTQYPRPTWRLIDDGTSTLEVSTNPDVLRAPVVRADKRIEVEKIVVRIDPVAILEAEVGVRYDFTAQVFNAENDALRWELRDRDGLLDRLPTDAGTHAWSVTIPPITWRTGECERALRVTARATTNTGARAMATDVREATATLLVQRPDDDPERECGDITLSPQDTCVGANGTARFTAEVFGLEDDRVRWHTTTGTISNDGVLTAGSETGDFIVTVEAASAPAVWQEARVRVGSCGCQWTFDGGGVSAAGTSALVGDIIPGTPDGYREDYRSVTLHGDTPESALVAHLPLRFFEGSGSYVATCAVNAGVAALPVGSYLFVCHEESPLGVTIDVRDAEGGQYAGTVSGIGAFRDPVTGAEFDSGFALDFVARTFDVGSRVCR